MLKTWLNILFFLGGLGSFALQAQSMMTYTDWMQKEKIPLHVKQLNEFIDRFNFEKSKLQANQASSALIFKKVANRIEMIWSLCNLDDTLQLPDYLIDNFAKEIGHPKSKTKIDFYDNDWYAELDCSVKYKGKNRFMTLILKNEQVSCPNERCSKWVIRSVIAPFLGIQPTCDYDPDRYLNPAMNDLDFTGIERIFKEEKNEVTHYAYKNFSIDPLSIFFYALQNGDLVFLNAEVPTYHFLQVPNWIFTVDFVAYEKDPSGWLISNICYVSDVAKRQYRIDKLGF